MRLAAVSMLLSIAACALAQTATPAQWSIGYWNSLGAPPCPIPEIDMTALTHISHWAALVRQDGTLDLNYHKMTADAPALITAAHAAGVKVIFSVVNPYWMGQSRNLPAAVTNKRAALVRNIMTAVNMYGYDGVNIDWEGAPPNIGALAADLRAELGTRLLMADAIVTDYRYWGSVQAHFDRVNVMTYDLSGTWNPYSWHNAALQSSDDSVWSIDLAVKRFVANGVPTAKLGIGIPFYGYQWSGGDISAPRQKWRGRPNLVQIHYNAIAPLIPQRTYAWDSAAHVPYLSARNSFLTFDDERSVAEKVNFAKANDLGGWIIWNLAMDYIPSASRKHPLLSAVAAARR